jgi:2,3-bisphosphoglycerate-dependent phosphoglycerate mutase
VSQPEGFRQVRYVPPAGATTVLLLRHGESAAARPEEPFPLRDGHGDPPLHTEGHRQAALVAERLRHERIDAIYVTTLQRTHQTAAPLAATLGMTPIEIADLREVYLGDWDGGGGVLRAKAAAADPLYLRMHAEQRWDIIPNAEPTAALHERTQRGLRTIVAAHPGGRVVAVVHGGVIGALLAAATGASGFAFNGSDNASLSELVIDGDRHVLRRFNDTAHLA